ncbi:MAG: DUF5119 domain-containing protein [Paramuribaculum sp.]|nr:DUF5119 domain-containing protein [Paramuribaculum sp.]
MKLSTTLFTLSAIISATSLTSCHHKDLLYDEPLTNDIEVVFDWRNAPDAQPNSMALYMFDEESGVPLRYIFTGRDGGTINLPFGRYNSLCMNADNTDWAVQQSTGDIEQFKTITTDVHVLPAHQIAIQSLPAGRADETERVAATPGMMWGHRVDGFEFRYTDTHKVLTMYPVEAVCHYTVDILDVKNIDALDETSVDATISGMAEGYLHGKGIASPEKVTNPFILTGNSREDKLSSEFLTFGRPSQPADDLTHTLTIYAILADGSKWCYTADVTDQVRDAPDPHHVHIILRNLTLPRNVQHTEGGAFNVDIDQWQTEHINLSL